MNPHSMMRPRVSRLITPVLIMALAGLAGACKSRSSRAGSASSSEASGAGAGWRCAAVDARTAGRDEIDRNAREFAAGQNCAERSLAQVASDQGVILCCYGRAPGRP